MKLEDFKNIVETRLKSESGNATEKSFLLEAYRVAEELKQIKHTEDKENKKQEEAKTNKTEYNDVEPKRVATILDFAKFKRKYCDCGTSCIDCPLSFYNTNKDIDCIDFLIQYPDRANEIILEHIDEHPKRTYRQDFCEEFPNASVDENGYPLARTCDIYLRRLFHCEFDCSKCWDKECKENA